MNLKLHEVTLIMESPSSRNAYVSFYVDYPERRSYDEQRFRSGYNLLAICGDMMDSDIQGLYIYPGIESRVIGVDII